MLKDLFKDRSIFFQLLAGGLSIMATVLLVAFLVNSHFVHRTETATDRRWMATSVVVQIRQLQQYEKDFSQREMFRRAFYDSGQSEALTKFREAATRISQSIDSLNGIIDEDGDPGSANLKEVFGSYVTAFEENVSANFARGRGENGVYGNWQAWSRTLDTLSEQAGADSMRMRLSRLHSDAIMSKSSQRANLLDTITAVTAELRRSGGSVPRFAIALNTVDSLFKQLYALQQRIGVTADDGLKGKLKQISKDMETAVQAIVNDAGTDAEAAQKQLRFMTPVVFVIGLTLAGLFFYYFATWISRMTNRLADTAAEVGRGNLSARAYISGQNELGRLATEFNRMAENLAMLVSSVQWSGTQVGDSAAEIAATSKEQQVTANEIATTTGQVSATAKEISATSQELASNMKHVAEVAEKTATIASAGQSGIGRMEATMKQITHASDSISARLGALSEKAQNITSVVTTITKVADQTNLLSLNAAIEAEKAGEYGRGFAVVATEIRRLADQTAQATSDIERIVKEMQSAVTAGVMGMDKFSEEVRRGVEASGEVGEQLTEIISQVQTLTPNFEMVNEGMQSQAEGAQQISESLSQLGVSARQTAESLGQSTRAIEQLNETARNLQAGVLRFTMQGDKK